MDEKLVFRRARPADAARIMEIIRQAQAQMRALGSLQWQDGYPYVRNVETDVSLGESYVVTRNGGIIATFVFMEREEPTYKTIDGAWRSDKPYAAIHRITVSPDARRTAEKCDAKSVSTEIMEFVKDKAARDGFDGGIRVDTHEGNIPMRKMLEKNGFVLYGYSVPAAERLRESS
mgnify:CR=1 FL=1